MYHFNSNASFMNNRYIVIILLCGLFTAGGCKKYLNVQPEGSYTETQVYGNERAIQQDLNGIYLDLASNALYGANLTTTIVEMLAQRYKPSRVASNATDLSVFNDYSYSSTVAQNIFDSTWRKAYGIILSTNVFLSKIDNSIKARVISETNGSLLKGEALAIRAMVHFDLLRLFGPVYAQNSGSPAIPYYTVADGKLQPILTASQVMDRVMADYTQAAQLLAQDPVITAGVTTSTDFYAGRRNERLNYYAVKELMARTFLWAGKNQEAHEAALAVLTDGEKWFPWTSYDAANDYTNPNRIFSPEILFAVYNPAMYTDYTSYFSPALSDDVILAPDSSRLNTVYEGSGSDYRYFGTWLQNGKPYRTFFKYADLTIPALPWRFLQPLVRKTELYFILAETDPDPVKGLDYLNTARRNRGLTPLTDETTIPFELRKEYQKEFWGEGQLFFYYKRIDATEVPSGTLPYSWATVNPVYVVPLPLSETATR
jgi:hypothetical protein